MKSGDQTRMVARVTSYVVRGGGSGTGERGGPVQGKGVLTQGGGGPAQGARGLA